jgi:hypothetical protein
MREPTGGREAGGGFAGTETGIADAAHRMRFNR